MAELEQNWRSKWDEECPLTIGVALQNWESWSDAVLRDELKRIRDTGFQTVRVNFNRDTDIEKFPGMINWRNPDRFFDAAQQAGLKVWCTPGNLPHRSLETSTDIEEWNEDALADTIRWIQRFCRQYSSHPALLAWVMELGTYFWYNDLEDVDGKQAIDRWLLLLRAFQNGDTEHPVLTLHPDIPEVRLLYCYYPVGLNHSSAPFGIPDLMPEQRSLATREWDRPFYTLAQLSAGLAASKIPVLCDVVGGTTNDLLSPFTMTSSKMQRILLLVLAAGFKSVVFDRWKPETTAQKAGESGFVDWLDRVTPAAQTAGHIAQSVERYQLELWHSRATPQVHIVLTPKSKYELLLGAALTLLNANVFFGFITQVQVMNDALLPAPILFLPGSDSISEALLTKLKTLVEQGTRLVTETLTGCFNDRDELLNTRPGSPFEQLFGVSIAGMFYMDAPNPQDAPTPAQLRAQMVTTTARAGGGSGEVPAFTENRIGKGHALLINLPLSQINATENLPNAQLSLLSYILGSRQTELPGLTGCLQFRRQSQNAEHVFLINDSAEERSVAIRLASSYTEARDVLADAVLNVVESSVSVAVPVGSGCWLRLS